MDWKKPPFEQLIYISSPYPYMISGAEWVPALEKEHFILEATNRLSANLFYATSFGGYTEKTNNQNVKSTQNFPVTLGYNFSMSDERRLNFFIGSLYWAQPTNGKINGNINSSTTNVSLPGEIGFNFYYQYLIKEFKVGVYSGYDYEKLNTFNTTELLLGSPVKNIVNEIHYGTLGVVKYFEYFKLDMSLKASFSKSVKVTSSSVSQLSGGSVIMFISFNNRK
jgi:hypothetical protein